jgi:hypothetical protein
MDQSALGRRSPVLCRLVKSRLDAINADVCSADLLHWSAVVRFFISFVAIIPLAKVSMTCLE